MHNSGIEKIASASGSSRYHDAHSPGAEDTVVLLSMGQSDNPAIIGYSDEVTPRKVGAQNREGLRNIQQMRNNWKVL